jgi:uncharacterized repeat protein (TIGR04138 family)
MTPELDINEIIILIRKEDARYARQAYLFVRDGLDATVKEIRKAATERPRATRHVTGRELSEGLRAYALEQYGPLSKTVLASWGIAETGDFGEIVYNFIEYSVFSKTEADRREDFDRVYDFAQAFEAPFRPTQRRLAAPSLAAEVD